MNFPLELTFKLFSIGNQVTVTDATGTLLYYVKQKAFTLKDKITIFADAEQTRPLYFINADKVIVSSARFHIAEPNGASLGSVKRQARKSLRRVHYDILHGQTPVFV